MTELMHESFRLVRAGERVGAIFTPLRCIVEMVGDVRKLAPELEPELNAVNERLLEALGHLSSAVAVLGAKVDVL